jgi:hypothetical protein
MNIKRVDEVVRELCSHYVNLLALPYYDSIYDYAADVVWEWEYENKLPYGSLPLKYSPAVRQRIISKLAMEIERMTQEEATK